MTSATGVEAVIVTEVAKPGFAFPRLRGKRANVSGGLERLQPAFDLGMRNVAVVSVSSIGAAMSNRKGVLACSALIVKS